MSTYPLNLPPFQHSNTYTPPPPFPSCNLITLLQVTSISDIKASGNWMWAAKLEGEGAKMWQVKTHTHHITPLPSPPPRPISKYPPSLYFYIIFNLPVLTTATSLLFSLISSPFECMCVCMCVCVCMCCVAVCVYVLCVRRARLFVTRCWCWDPASTGARTHSPWPHRYRARARAT